MKLKWLVLTLIVAALAAWGGWILAKRADSGVSAAGGGGERKILYYQSSMHPWIKSDKPGNCTICGMKLTPVYEGEKGFETSPDVVALSPSMIQVLHVRTEEAQERSLVRTLRVAGRIDDNEARRRFVSAYIEGRIDRLAVNYTGAEVVEGEPLALFYSPSLLTAEREYATLLRQKPLSNSPELLAEHQKLVSLAGERLKRLGLSPEQILDLENKEEFAIHTQIRAPMTGTVIERMVYEGQYVTEGEKLFQIGDFSTMWFQFDAYERDLAWLRVGQLVDVTTPAVPGKVFTAPITFIDPNLNPMTRSARVRVEIPNPVIEEKGARRRELFHRLYADGLVRIEIPEVLAVPRSAVLALGVRNVAFVDLGGGNYEQRLLTLGRFGDGYWEVLAGIEAGEQVVVQGNLMMDAQAQLNQTAHPGEHQHVPPPATERSGPTLPRGNDAMDASALSEEQRQTARDFFETMDVLAKTLAEEKLEEYNSALPKLHKSVEGLREEFEAESKSPLQRIETNGHLGRAASLGAARKSFLPLSMAAADFAKALRGGEGFEKVKVFRCPMVDDAIPGAAKNGFWVQLGGSPRNPFFGPEMLECGVEVP